MKKLVLLTIMAMISIASIGQLYYKGYDIIDPMYGQNYSTNDNFVSFKNLGNGKYRIAAWVVLNETYILNGEFIFSNKDEDGDYVYVGTLFYHGVDYQVAKLTTKVKLSEYSGAKSVSLYNTLRFMPLYKDKDGNWSAFRMFKLTLKG